MVLLCCTYSCSLPIIPLAGLVPSTICCWMLPVAGADTNSFSTVVSTPAPPQPPLSVSVFSLQKYYKI